MLQLRILDWTEILVIGKKHFMLEVVEKLSKSRFLCKCDCGNTRILKIGHFNTGHFKSCGCHWKTGLTNSREQMSYANMMARCHNPKNKRYKDYGEVGIVVCKEWRNNFKQFYKDMGPCPDGYQIDRIDNTKGYSKENCRWTTPKKNMNNRSNSGIWTVNGAEYESSKLAALDLNLSTATIIAWCKGRIAQGRYYAPKPGCSFRYLYK
jgi:hypothetical protein